MFFLYQSIIRSCKMIDRTESVTVKKAERIQDSLTCVKSIIPNKRVNTIYNHTLYLLNMYIVPTNKIYVHAKWYIEKYALHKEASRRLRPTLPCTFYIPNQSSLLALSQMMWFSSWCMKSRTLRDGCCSLDGSRFRSKTRLQTHR